MDQYYDNVGGYTNLDPTEEYRLKSSDLPNYGNRRVNFKEPAAPPMVISPDRSFSLPQQSQQQLQPQQPQQQQQQQQQPQPQQQPQMPMFPIMAPSIMSCMPQAPQVQDSQCIIVILVVIAVLLVVISIQLAIGAVKNKDYAFIRDQPMHQFHVAP